MAPSFFRATPSFASDWAAVEREVTFFFRRMVPLPPVEVEEPPNRFAIILARASASSVSDMLLSLVVLALDTLAGDRAYKKTRKRV